MSQTTLDDDELFSEAANEMRADVEEALESARAAIPDADTVWSVEAENALGMLNALRSALDVGDAADHLRSAKKWYTMGKRAGAFDDADDLEREIASLEALFEQLADARDQASGLASTLPALREELSALGEASEDAAAVEAEE